MNNTHNGLNDMEYQNLKDKKKVVPNFNQGDFTGEYNISNKNEQEREQDPLKDLINSCKLDLSEVMAPPPIALQIVSDSKPITLFTKGNFSIVTGAAKSRKSFLISMLMATAIKGSFQDLFSCADKGINILFDTEQSRYKALQVSNRICQLSEQVIPDNFHSYSLRILDPKKRMELIDDVLATTPNLNFVAIDGIIDLDIDPILEAKQAQNIVLKLMQWTEIYNIHICNIIHQNKGDGYATGHIGSFVLKKAETVISVEKATIDKRRSIVNCDMIRGVDSFEPFGFEINEHGLPELYKIIPKVDEPKMQWLKPDSRIEPQKMVSNEIEWSINENVPF